MAIARISGPLLAANLKRTLSNLAFETDLLYIGALNGRIGVRADSPNAELNVNGQINTPNVYATRLTGGNLEFSTTGVRAITGDIILNAVENIKIDRLQTTGTQRIEINDNDIRTYQNNDDIVFNPNQSGRTHFLKDTKVTGNATATGNVTIPGNVTVGGNFDLGNTATDTVDFDFVRFTQDLVPRATTDLLNLGSTTKRFNDLYLGGDVVIGHPTAALAVTHTIQSTGNAELSVGTTNDPVKTLYVEDINMSGTIVGFGADTIETIGSTSNPMDTAHISNVSIASGKNITTNGVKGLDIQKTDGTVIFTASTGTLQNIALANTLVQGDGIISFTYDGSTASKTVAVDSTVVRTTGTQPIAGTKTFEAEIIADQGLDATEQTIKWGSLSDGTITVTQFVDEDNMASNSATQIPTQQSVKAYVDTSLSSGFTSDSNNTRDLGASGNKWANVYATTFQGVATTAQYADMAEVYSSDADYEAGTVVKLGGDAEITMTTTHADTDVFGVISTSPAYLMNAEAEGLPVAMTGRVPVKVIGKISKGERLVSSDVPGLAWALGDDQYDTRAVIGRSLEDKNDGNEGIVEAVVGVK